MSNHNFFKTFLAILACRLTRAILRLLHRGGTTLPGRMALVFDKKILEVVSQGMHIIVVTGTNGKTTTCSMLRNALQESGINPLSNISGANLLTGITAEFASQATLFGKPKKEYAIIECDEASLKKVAPLINPEVIVVTNLFRDQLDRYGEIMHTLNEIKTGISLVPDTILCLNSDCSLTASLATKVPNPVYFYGIGIMSGNSNFAGNPTDSLSDAKYCIHCGTEYKYRYHTYAHLGGFYCPNCGYTRVKPDLEVTSIDNYTSKSSDITLRFGRYSCKVHIGLPALYNIYNAIAAIGAFECANLDRQSIINSLATVNSSFGRMEGFIYNNVDVQMILVKNPAGCNQTLDYLASLKEDYVVLFSLNDKTADGHDISWIWDVDYEKVINDTYCKGLFVSGTRGKDMKVRLKYGNAYEEEIRLIRPNEDIMSVVTESTLPVFILPNYTAMLSLRAELSSATGKKEFWKDQSYVAKRA